MNADLRFVSTGFGTIVQCNMIWSIMRIRSEQSKRIVREAKSENRWLDYTARRPMKSIILLTNNVVIGSPFSVATLYGRIREATERSLGFDTYTEQRLRTEAKKHISEIEEDYSEDEDDTEREDGEFEDLDEDQD